MRTTRRSIFASALAFLFGSGAVKAVPSLPMPTTVHYFPPTDREKWEAYRRYVCRLSDDETANRIFPKS